MMSDNSKLAIMIKTFLNGGKLYKHGGQYHDEDGNPIEVLGREDEDDSGDGADKFISGERAARVLANLLDREVRTTTADRGGFDERGGFVSATESTSAPITTIPVGLGEREGEAPSEDAPERMRVIKGRGPSLIRQSVDKDLKGDTQDMEDKKSDTSPILHTPSTSNIRVFKGGEDGPSLYGGEKDAFAKGFKRGDQDFYASPKVYDLMRKEGINPNDKYAVEFMKDLQKNNPELFSNKNEFSGAINNMVIKEANTDPQSGRGFFIPKQKIRASF